MKDRAFQIALALTCAALALPAAAAAFGDSFPSVKQNPADSLARYAIDEYQYDTATRCTNSVRAGMSSLQRWLERHAAGTSWGIMRCEKWGKGSASLHAEGRAIDWALNARIPTERRAARRLISLLLATDKAGNTHALARRMGVQEIIFDCQGWFSGSDGMRPYSACFNREGKARKRVDDSTAHRNHVHIGLNRDGAAKRTSFWLAPDRQRQLPPAEVPEPVSQPIPPGKPGEPVQPATPATGDHDNDPNHEDPQPE